MVDAAAAADTGADAATDSAAAAAVETRISKTTDSADAAAVETEQLAQRWAWAPQGCIVYIQYNLRLVFVHGRLCYGCQKAAILPHKMGKKEKEGNTTRACRRRALDMGDIRLSSFKN